MMNTITPFVSQGIICQSLSSGLEVRSNNQCSGMKTQLCNENTHNRWSFDYAHLATVADAAILIMDKPLILPDGWCFKTNLLIKHLPHFVLWRPFVI